MLVFFLRWKTCRLFPTAFNCFTGRKTVGVEKSMDIPWSQLPNGNPTFQLLARNVLLRLLHLLKMVAYFKIKLITDNYQHAYTPFPTFWHNMWWWGLGSMDHMAEGGCMQKGCASFCGVSSPSIRCLPLHDAHSTVTIVQKIVTAILL